MKNNRRTLFYSIVGVVVLIITVVGVTYSWFTATAAGDAVTVTSGTFTITYNNGTSLNATDLKPATLSQVNENQGTCLYKTETAEYICSKYTFTITNTGTISGTISLEVADLVSTYTANELLYFAFVEGTTVASTYIEDVPNVFNGSFRVSEQLVLAPGATKTYTLLIWLNEGATIENQGKSLTGTLLVVANQNNMTTPAVE